MGNDRALLPDELAAALSESGRAVREARRAVLDACSPATTEWEYDGRRWHWPGGEELPYFWELCDREAALIDDLAATWDLDRVGVGTGRVALRLPDAVGEQPLVVKLARSGPSAEMGDGRAQNLRERSLSRRFGGHPFLDVREAHPDGDWVVMPRAGILDPDDPGTGAAIDAVRDALTPYRGAVHVDELKPENVGAFDGRYWLVDYGRPPARDRVPAVADD